MSAAEQPESDPIADLDDDRLTTFAAMAVKIGLIAGQASFEPPGIRLGPTRAPSSPPETPAPMKRIPASAQYLSRRSVSV